MGLDVLLSRFLCYIPPIDLSEQSELSIGGYAKHKNLDKRTSYPLKSSISLSLHPNPPPQPPRLLTFIRQLKAKNPINILPKERLNVILSKEAFYYEDLRGL